MGAKMIIIILIIWFGDTVTVCRTLQNVIQTQKCTLNQKDVFLSALQMYPNQKRKTSNQQAKDSNCWGQPLQKDLKPQSVR